MKKNRKTTGVALITAMLVVSLATVTAVSMTSEQQVYFRRTENLLLHEQAYLYLLGAEDWARHVLLRDRKDNDTDSAADDWATILPPIVIEGGTIGGAIEDLQGRFNINNLVNSDDNSIDTIRFRKLLQNNGIDVSVINAVKDWLDEDQEARFPGAEDVDYMQGERGYRAANRMMQSTSELLYVKGITYEIYDKLAPALVALPELTDININTAPLPVLMMIVEDLTAEDAERLVADRSEEPFKSIEEFLQHHSVAGKQVNTNGLTLSSQYFMVDAVSRFGRTTARMQSVLHRPDADSIRTIARSQGGL